MARKLPFLQFYPDDWLSDEKLRLCSLAARGLWMDILSVMHKCDRRGFLQQANGTPYSTEQIARVAGCSIAEAAHLLQELIDAGVTAADQHGTIYSRRMVRDERTRKSRMDAGRMGAAAKWENDGSPGHVRRSQRLAEARTKATHTDEEWRHLLIMCGSCCVRCGNSESVVKDHILPLYQGGSDGIDNLQPLCRSCNSRKGSDTTDCRPAQALSWLSQIGKAPGKLPGKLCSLYSDSSSLGNGGAGERGHTEPETVCDAPRSNLPCDNVESYPAARKVVEHYQATVRPAHPRGGGIQAVIGLMNSGRLPGQLVKAAEGYAAECEQQGKSKQHRLSVTTFYGPGGSWEDYVNGKPRPELRTSLTPDERAEKVLRQRQILDARVSTNGNGVHT